MTNESFVMIVSQPDGSWLAETPTFPMCKGQASTPDKALANLVNSITIHLQTAAKT